MIVDLYPESKKIMVCFANTRDGYKNIEMQITKKLSVFNADTVSDYLVRVAKRVLLKSIKQID